MAEHSIRTSGGVIIQDPPIARFLFQDTRMAWLWLVIRVLVGWQWMTAGIEKVQNPAWMQGGAALKGFWESAIQIPQAGRPPITYDWYRGFIQSMLNAQAYAWFGPLVAVGETLVGAALIAGAFVGIAAFAARS